MQATRPPAPESMSKTPRPMDVAQTAQTAGVKRRRQSTRPSPPITLPLLSIQCAEHDIVNVHVMDVPTMGEGKGLTWIVQSRPEIQLGKRQHVVLKTNAQRSGIGRLTSVADLRRHWVIFTVSGAPHSCNLRVPIPWAALDDLESFTHSKFYFTLPALPRPHAEFSSPIFTSDEENPYEFELGERAESRSERLIARITNADADRRTSRSKMTEGPDGRKGGSESDSSGHTSMRIIPGSLAG